MSTDDEDKSYPRSVRHKQILDKAKAHPNASMDELASMVPSATTELVERTLDEYGDPATTEEPDSSDGEGEQDSASGEATEPTADFDGGVSIEMTDANTTSTDSTTESSAATVSENSTDVDEAAQSEVDGSADTGDDENEHSDAGHATGEEGYSVPTPETLSPKQREVLEHIAANPTATQREIGDELGVSSATVNNRVNSIDGFEWSDRASFVDAVFDADVETDVTGTDDPAGVEDVESTLAGIENQLQDLDERMGMLEERIGQERVVSDGSGAGLDDPELVHKIVHACIESERVSEEEELQLIQHVLS